MDDQSAALILQLQLEDISSILASAKGKGRAGDAPANDHEHALRLTQQELEANVAILHDRAMGQSIARAVQADRHILAREAAAEEAAARDRRLACEMDGRPAAATDGGVSGGASACDTADEGADDAAQDEYLAKLMALYVSEADGAELLAAGSGSGVDDEDAAGGESSSRGAKRGGHRAAIDRRCEACHDEKKFFDVATLPHCRHDYCRDCLDLLFRLSMADESLFPPRCCRQPIQLRDVRVFLSAETAREFEERRPELETPNRTYCHLATCSAWIPPRDISDEVGQCPACAAATCTICKAAAHDGECPNDEATQMLLRMADESGWQRCFNCRRVVELDVGCYHMSCRCGAQFCYGCGQRWKTCACPQWEEEMLFRRAAQIHQRLRLAAPAPAAAPALPAAPVPDAAPIPDAPPIQPAAPALPAQWEEMLYRQAAQIDQLRLAATALHAAPAPDAPPVQPAAPARRDLPTPELEDTDHQSEEGGPPSPEEDLAVEELPIRPAPALPRGLQEMSELLAVATEAHAALQDGDLEAIVQHLRENHECTHQRWNFVRGRHQCEECFHTLPQYIFECRQCMVRACNRCRRNRL